MLTNDRLRGLSLALPLLMLAACGLQKSESEEKMESEMAGKTVDQAQLEANKKVVLDMWHEVVAGRNIEAAPKYISTDYIQNSPGTPSGVEALMDFLRTEFPDSEPLEPGSYEPTAFEFVMAEGDLVQLMFKREMPSQADPEKTVPVWWYDTYRVQDGMIVEHWDSIHN